MALHVRIQKIDFHFHFDARTSRGPMKDKSSWFIILYDDSNPETKGIGECGPLPGLSPEYGPDLNATIEKVAGKLIGSSMSELPALLQTGFHSVLPPHHASLLFALETAALDLLNGGQRRIADSDFVRGSPIPINGLVWMGSKSFMLEQVEKKLLQGFSCIKLKVGGIDFEQECDILDFIRQRYDESAITLRLDANGAFTPHEALEKLTILSSFGIQSIEQPVKPGEAIMKTLSVESPIPIALDEELIGNDGNRKDLLDKLRPQFIVLKPTLHGGLQGCREWINEADKMGIGWWITSALESNIGLNAICQFTGCYPVTIPQGLGTGSLYENNFTSPLRVRRDSIFFDNTVPWDSKLLDL